MKVNVSSDEVTDSCESHKVRRVVSFRLDLLYHNWTDVNYIMNGKLKLRHIDASFLKGHY